MKLQGQHTFEVPRDVVWQALLDPEVLARTLPGCEDLQQVGENEYQGALNIRVGPVQGKFQGTVKLSDLMPPEGYHLHLKGSGPAGFMDGDGELRLEAQGAATVLHYDLDAKVGGRVATVGHRLLDSSARAVVRQGLEGLEKQLAALASGAGEEARAAPSQTEFAAGVAKEVLGELVPPRYRPLVLVGAAVILAFLIFLLVRACQGG